MRVSGGGGGCGGGGVVGDAWGGGMGGGCGGCEVRRRCGNRSGWGNTCECLRGRWCRSMSRLWGAACLGATSVTFCGGHGGGGGDGGCVGQGEHVGCRALASLCVFGRNLG